MALSLLALTPQGRALVRKEQKRTERDDHEGEAPGRIEREMSEVRSRMAPNLSDLREHVEPQALKERVKRSLRERLRIILSSANPSSRDHDPAD
jgi:hypothetical protein